MTIDELKGIISDFKHEAKTKYSKIYDDALEAMLHDGDPELIREFYMLAGERVAYGTLLDIIEAEEGNNE